ncbi:hypothetical protein QBC35DRAFT_446451 [Podospora australis]|uniref:C2H2-type domain-containing protein n=1 Tax=Podospora australis TaxID=1536484 RepID=A0AAN6X597_9PEZI|nr:hypothetical protein QBC35DRAFT_446451 [Podospora australis]
MAREDSPGDDSPLSSMASSEDEYPDRDDADNETIDEPPTKRIKTATGSVASPAFHKETSPDPDALDTLSLVSSDTDGDVPNSPLNSRQDEEDHQEQVTVCKWEGCRAGDQGNMDKLVEHIHSDHIETRAKKYTCEWYDCSRKGMAHASGYALKAHMRSHTREKPFYCYLPECQRAFTRSDALAKHMRTVHQTEDLRPSDPVSKAHHSAGVAGKTSKALRIVIKTPQSHAAGQDDVVDDDTSRDGSSDDLFTHLDKEHFTDEELDMPIQRLYKMLRAEVRWAENEGEVLRDECKKYEEMYKQEWLEKEVALEQVKRSEQAYNARKKAVRASALDVMVTGEGLVVSGEDPAAHHAAMISNN